MAVASKPGFAVEVEAEVVSDLLDALRAMVIVWPSGSWLRSSQTVTTRFACANALDQSGVQHGLHQLHRTLP